MSVFELRGVNMPTSPGISVWRPCGASPAPSSRVGCMPLWAAPAAENMMYPMELRGMKPAAAKKRAAELIGKVGLPETVLDRFPAMLSGGEQQRVAVARALGMETKVLLADEPTGNLDSKNSQEIVELLKMSNKKYNQTLIIITHDESIALQADRIIAIEDGRIVKDERIRRG